MSRQPRPAPGRQVPPAYRCAFERLDAVLERTAPVSHTADLQALGRALFGDVFANSECAPVLNPESDHGS